MTKQHKLEHFLHTRKPYNYFENGTYPNYPIVEQTTPFSSSQFQHTSGTESWIPKRIVQMEMFRNADRGLLLTRINSCTVKWLLRLNHDRVHLLCHFCMHIEMESVSWASGSLRSPLVYREKKMSIVMYRKKARRNYTRILFGGLSISIIRSFLQLLSDWRVLDWSWNSCFFKIYIWMIDESEFTVMSTCLLLRILRFVQNYVC